MEKINTNINASLFMFYGEICNLREENILLFVIFSDFWRYPMSNPGRQSLMIPNSVTPRASMSLSPDPPDIRKTELSIRYLTIDRAFSHCRLPNNHSKQKKN